MFSDKRLIICYKGDSIDEDEWRGGEWFDADESTLRNQIAKTFDALGYHSHSIEDEVFEAYNKMLNNGGYELPNCRFELIEKY